MNAVRTKTETENLILKINYFTSGLLMGLLLGNIICIIEGVLK